METLPLHRANVNLRSGLGAVTALHTACYHGYEEIALALIDKSACVNDKHREANCTPLHMACYGGNLRIAEALLNKGAMVLEKDYKGFTPLHAAVRGGQCNLDIVRLLLSVRRSRYNRCLVDDRDNNGNSALLLACQHGHFMAVMVLLDEGGADRDLQNHHQQTPLLNALKYDHPLIASALMEKGSCIHTANMAGQSAIHFACLCAQFDIALTLIAKGACINGRDKDFGLRPIDAYGMFTSLSLPDRRHHSEVLEDKWRREQKWRRRRLYAFFLHTLTMEWNTAHTRGGSTTISQYRLLRDKLFFIRPLYELIGSYI